MILRPSPISTSAFTYVEGKFVAEASSLPPFGRVWDDACDTGLTLISARTGREVVCAVEREERDGDGDLLWEELVPVHSSGARGAFTVRVFND